MRITDKTSFYSPFSLVIYTKTQVRHINKQVVIKYWKVSVCFSQMRCTWEVSTSNLKEVPLVEIYIKEYNIFSLVLMEVNLFDHTFFNDYKSGFEHYLFDTGRS